MTKTLSQKLRRAAQTGRLRGNLRNNNIITGNRLLRRVRRGRRVNRLRNSTLNVNRRRFLNQPLRRNPTRIGRALRSAGRLAGTFFGQPTLGEGLGAGISRVFGQGDYIVNNPISNTMMNTNQLNLVTGGGPPAMSPLTTGFRLTHREYLRDVYSSQPFTSFTLNLNPGLSDTFPWLADVARNFEEYKIHGMVVYLNSTAGMAIASTSSALGYWGVVTQYDASDDPFNSKQQCENYVGCQTAVVYKNIIHGIECQPRANVLDRHYVRTGPLDVNEDIKFYDHGIVQVFTGGSQSAEANVLGELWVSYDIEFTKPRVPAQNQNTSGMHWYATSGVTSSNLAGNNQSVVAGNAPGLRFNGGSIFWDGNTGLSEGVYMVTLNVLLSTAGSITVPTLNINGVMTLLNEYAGGSAYRLYAPNPSGTITSNSMLATYLVRYDDTNDSGNITFFGATVTSAIASEVVVVYIGDGVITPDNLGKHPNKKLTSEDVKQLKDLVTLKPLLQKYTQLLLKGDDILSIQESDSEDTD